jgi:hypothetical protein
MPLVKWLLAIPHYVVLTFLWIGAFLVVVFAWFAILHTGYPRGHSTSSKAGSVGTFAWSLTRSCSSPNRAAATRLLPAR